MGVACPLSIRPCFYLSHVVCTGHIAVPSVILYVAVGALVAVAVALVVAAAALCIYLRRKQHRKKKKVKLEVGVTNPLDHPDGK